MKLTSVNERLPAYGEPVLIKTNGVLQHITYILDGADDVPDWFEPCHFEADGLALRWDKVESWIYVDDVAKALGAE